MKTLLNGRGWMAALFLVSALLPRLSAAADETPPQGGEAAKPDARYLALLGFVHSTSERMQGDLDSIKKGLECGEYGKGWGTMHKEVTQSDIDAFGKDVAAVLCSKTPAEAAPSLKAIESLADRLHKACAADASSSVWKIATLLALSKDAKSPAVASSLLKRADKIKTQAFMAIDKDNGKGSWSTVYEAKCCRSVMLLQAYRMGLGLWDMPKSDFLMETEVFTWPGDDFTQPKVESAKCKKSLKLAESAINTVLAADGVLSAQNPGKGKVALAALDKAVKASVSVVLSPNGPSKPTPEASAQVDAACSEDYAVLLEYLKGKSTVPTIQRELEANAARVRKSAEKKMKSK